MEKWLFKWRLEINAKKCQFIIFGRKKHVSELKLKLFNELIPRVNETRFLRIILDSRMNFIKCVEEIVNKCSNRLNILKKKRIYLQLLTLHLYNLVNFLFASVQSSNYQ
jgi:hypothetical protein